MFPEGNRTIHRREGKTGEVYTVKRFYIKTFGCQMNEYDSARIQARLVGMGLQEVDSPDAADVVLINTCTVREKAAQKALHLVRHASKRGKRVVVVGCLAQQMKERLLEHGAHAVVGPRSYAVLPKIVLEDGGSGGVYCEDLLDHDHTRELRLEPGQVSAFLTIMVGCDHFCTFCIVPYTRGREVSRPVHEVVEDALYLERRGVVELTLLGQNVNAYTYGAHDFADLLAILDRRTRFLWIKFTSPHPADITVKVLDTIARSRRLSPWIHLPLQAGSTRILREMRRGYTKEEFIEIAHTVRRMLPESTITTDVMVGFPGETEEDFLHTLDVVRTVEFDGAYMFIYSPRPGTPAAKRPDQVPEEEKGRRLRVLIEEVNRGIARRRARLIGKRVEVLVEGPSQKDPSFTVGKTRNHTSVIAPGRFPVGALLRGRVREIRGLTPVMEVDEVVAYEDLLELLGYERVPSPS